MKKEQAYRNQTVQSASFAKKAGFRERWLPRLAMADVI
jgi:hypothetical protein